MQQKKRRPSGAATALVRGIFGRYRAAPEKKEKKARDLAISG